ncbi:hypothetical protein BH23PLA1_BH23PLA1_07610 [soil metagenome]
MALLAGLAVLAVWQTQRTDRVAEAKQAYQASDYQTTLRLAFDQLARWPGDSSAARLAALGLSQRDFPVKAEPYYQIAEAAGQLDSDDQLVRALALIRAGRHSEAETVLQGILDQDPEHVPALQRLAALMQLRQDMIQARALATRLSQIPEGAVNGHALLGSIYQDENLGAEAAEAYLKALAMDPEGKQLALPIGTVYSDLAACLVSVGAPDQAREQLEMALSKRLTLSPADRGQMLQRLGEAYLALNQPEPAEQAWRESLRHDSTNHEAYLDLGQLALRERPEEAIGLFKRAAELSPIAPEPHYNLSIAYTLLDRLEEAERSQADFQRLRRESGRARTGMGAMPMPSPDRGPTP